MAVDSRESAEDVQHYRDQYGFHVDFGWDEYNDVYNNYMGSGYPTSVAIDCQDPPKVIWTRSGLCDDNNGCVQELQALCESEVLKCGQPPELSNASFDPAVGKSNSTDFSFYVDYYDADEDPPDSINVYVNGNPHAMSLDSGAPEDGTYFWTGEIAEDGTATYYFDCDDGGNGTDRLPDSGTLNGPYVYDDWDPPESSCTAPARSRDSVITIDYVSTDTYSGVFQVDLYIQYEGSGYTLLDSSNNPNGTFTAALTAGNGTYDFYTRATDVVGNVEDAPGVPDSSCLFDNVPPVSSADGGIAPYWTGLPITVDFTANDALSGVASTSLWYRFSNGIWIDSGLSSSQAAGTFDFNAPSGQGVYDFYTIAIDLNGNVENAPGAPQATAHYDATKPAANCTTVGETNQYFIEVNFTATDNDQVASTALWSRFNAGTWTDFGSPRAGGSGTFDYPLDDGDGQYDFYTISEDMAGNSEDVPAEPEASVIADFTMPNSSCTAGALVNSLPFDVDFVAADTGTGVASTKLWYRYEGEPWQDSYQTLTGDAGVFSLDPTEITPQFRDGIYQLMTIATDNVGNNESPPVSPDAAAMLDTTAPESSVTCAAETTGSPLLLNYTAEDALSGVASVALWYRSNGGDWTDTGLVELIPPGFSAGVENGVFSFSLVDGSGLYEFYSVATDVAGNVESPVAPDASSIYDIASPVSTSQTESIVNTPTISIEYSSVDELTAIANVHLFYRFTDLDGIPDDTLRDTGLEQVEAAGTFVWAPDMGPGLYNFFVSATDVAGNVENTDGAPDAVCLFDPRMVMSEVTGPSYVTDSQVPLTFATQLGADGYDHVTLFYRYGVTLEDAEVAAWIETAIVAMEPFGILQFECLDGDGYYQFYTTAESEGGLIEPAPDTPDCTTIADSVAPDTLVEAPQLSPTSQFELTYSGAELFGLASLDIFYCYDGDCYLFTTLHDLNGTVIFDAQGVEGEYEFYSIGTDSAGNVEGVPLTGQDCVVTVDLAPPVSEAMAPLFGTGFPIVVDYIASDTVTTVTNVTLLVKYESGDWTDTGLSSVGGAGTFNYTPDELLEGTYSFCTIGTDDAGHTEFMPAMADAQATIDWTAPQTSCSTPEYSNAALVQLSYTASDALAGMEAVTFWTSIDGGAWLDTGLIGSANGGVVEVDLSPWGEGTFGFCTLGVDKAGNHEELPVSPVSTTVYDATVPTSVAEIPTEGICSNTAPVLVPYMAYDALSGISSVSLWTSFNGGAWVDSGLEETPSVLAAGTFSFTPAHGDGEYKFATLAIDVAGNVEALPVIADGGSLVFDETAPSSSVSFETTYAKEFPITLDYVASDLTSGIANVALWVSLDGGPFVNTGVSAAGTAGVLQYTPAVLSDGEYRFYSIAVDLSGNAEVAPVQADVTTIVDVGAPVSAASCEVVFTNQFPIVVSFTASDAASGLADVKLWVNLNGGEFADTGLSSFDLAGTFTYLPDALLDGTYGFYTQSRDHAGNTEAAPVVPDVSVMIDRTKPLSSCNVEPTLMGAFPVSINYTSSDGGSGVEQVKLFFRVDSGPWNEAVTFNDATGIYDFAPAAPVDGYFEFYTKAYDMATNVENTVGTDDAVRVDTTAPMSRALAPAKVNEPLILVSFTARDDGSGVSGTSLWYRHNGGIWLDSALESAGTVGQFEFEATEGEGSYEFYTLCTDNIGNLETVPEEPDGTTVYVIPAPEIYVSITELAFGDVEIGQTALRRFSITNNGDAVLSISDVSVSDAAFSFDLGLELPVSLAASNSLLTDVRFEPSTEGEYTAELQITSDDPNTPTYVIDLSGTGVEPPDQLILDVFANGDVFAFDDDLDVSISVQNIGDPVTADVYLVLTYDMDGPDKMTWSASFTEIWVDGLEPVASDYVIGDGYDVNNFTWWSSTLPSSFPQVSMTGTYTLELFAVEPGTMVHLCDAAIDEFEVIGEPYVDILTDKATYELAGDTLSITLDVQMPDFPVTGDFYVVLKDPDGNEWSPSSFGEGVVWSPNAAPMFPSITVPAGFEFANVSFIVELPSAAPFDVAGDFTLTTMLVRGGTFEPFSDRGTATFTLE
ncbi:choice-of-anchor D domain-containing protein [bacterium]|nr:choice-of-anchor D domain-containing protein [bacterium]